MKKHEKYKDSGIKWIREIPQHWNITILKYLLSYKLMYEMKLHSQLIKINQDILE